jgi:hypothetical protein
MPKPMAMMLITKAITLMNKALLSVSPDKVMSMSAVLVSHKDRLMMAPRYLRMGFTLSLSSIWDRNHRGHQGDHNQCATCANGNR